MDMIKASLAFFAAFIILLTLCLFAALSMYLQPQRWSERTS
jgi:hypothetical protein